MKNRILGIAFVAVLLFSVLIGVQFVRLAAANFIYDDPYTPEPDKNPPTISILSPENKTYTVNNVSLAFGVSEHISWASYSLDGQANVTIGNIPLVHGIGTFGNTTLIGLPDGTHSLIVYARDEARNKGSSDMIYFTIDTIAPSISILSLENKTYDTIDIPLNFTLTEPVSWMGYSLDGQANVTITGNTTLTGLSYGSHNLVVYARDTAGNTGASETIYFSIKTEPFLTTWIVGAVVALAAGSGCLLLNVKSRLRHRKHSVAALSGEDGE